MNRRYKIIAMILAASTISSSIVFADEITDAKNKSEQIQQEIEENKASIAAMKEEKENIMTEVSSLNNEIQNLTTEVDRLNIQITESEEKIQELEKRAEELREEIELNKEIMNTRFRVIYQTNGTSYLNLLLESEGIGDFFDKLDTVRIMINYNKEIMDQFNRDQLELAENTLAVGEEKRSLEEAKATVDKSLYALEDKKAKKEKLMQEAESNIATAQAIVDQQEADFNEILASITQMEEQAKEELKKQEEANNQSNQSNQSNQNNSSSGNTGGSTSQGSVSTNGLYRITRQRYVITSGFVDRINPVTGKKEFHKGIDIGAPYGDPVYSLKAGVVTYSGWMTGYGNVVVVSHGGGMSTLYAHNSSLSVSVGQSVAGGQQIAVVGSTGWSTGPHIHFEVIMNGVRVNPSGYYI